MMSFLKKSNFIWAILIFFYFPLYAQYEMNLEFPAESNGLFSSEKPAKIMASASYRQV